MADMAGGQTGWDQLAEGMALKQAVSSTDAVSAIERAEANKGQQRRPLGGREQRGRLGPVLDQDRGGRHACGLQPVERAWSHRYVFHLGERVQRTLVVPDVEFAPAAATWATRVLGEREQRTCETCTKTSTTPGVALTPLIQEEYEAKLKALQELVSGAKPTTAANLDAAGSASLPLTRGVIEALRDEPDHGSRWASAWRRRSPWQA